MWPTSGPQVAHSDDGIGVPPGTGVAPVGKMDPPQLPEIFGERRCSGVDVCGPAPVPPPNVDGRGGSASIRSALEITPVGDLWVTRSPW